MSSSVSVSTAGKATDTVIFTKTTLVWFWKCCQPSVSISDQQHWGRDQKAAVGLGMEVKYERNKGQKSKSGIGVECGSHHAVPREVGKSSFHPYTRCWGITGNATISWWRGTESPFLPLQPTDTAKGTHGHTQAHWHWGTHWAHSSTQRTKHPAVQSPVKKNPNQKRTNPILSVNL